MVKKEKGVPDLPSSDFSDSLCHPFQVGNQPVRIFFSGGPARTESYRAVCFIHPFLIIETILFSKFFQNMIRNHGKNLIGLILDQKRKTCLRKRFAQLIRQPVRMAGNFQIKSVLKQRLKLHAQQAALGQHTALLLDEIAEILFQLFI